MIIYSESASEKNASGKRLNIFAIRTYRKISFPELYIRRTCNFSSEPRETYRITDLRTYEPEAHRHKITASIRLSRTLRKEIKITGITEIIAKM